MAELNVLSVENVSKSFGERTLFSDLSFGLGQGDKAALIARNGAGKSTLLRMIAGKEYPDSGEIVVRNGIRVGMLDQEMDFDPELTVIEAMMTGELPALEAVREYEMAIQSKDEKLLRQTMSEMDRLHAWDLESQMHEMIGRLKLSDAYSKVGQLSGGQQKRLALAQLLIAEPDLMILDEPTNHLDLAMIEWLEIYLTQKKSTLLLVTHDRYFLEVICNEIFELDDGQLHLYKGNYSYFLEKKAERESENETVLAKKKQFLRKEVEWIRRQPKARGTKSKSRTDTFYKVKKEAQQGYDGELKPLNVKIPRLGTKILEFHKLSKGFDSIALFDHFNYVYQRGEKVGLIGPNGSGKTTLVKLILSQLAPDTGKIVIGETIKIGYFSQDGLPVRDDKRVIEVITDIAEYIQLEKGHKLSASQLLERFMFDRKMQWQWVSTLSGGEKKRLYLLSVLMQNPNFLILDEPTNDLDVYTLSVLEDYLQSFKGGLLVISHDRYFMDKIIDHLFVFDGSTTIRDYPGNYTQYRLKEQKRKAQNQTESKVKKAPPKKKEASHKITYAERIELEKLEQELEKLDKQKEELTHQLQQFADNHEKLTALGSEIKETIHQIEIKSDRWIELSEKVS